jgi:putative ATP-dependent endonuclease of OLD family
MYLSNLKLWNFRKFGSASFDIENPDLNLDFNKKLNVLIGENDSGKTAIIDAIKIVLKTHSYEWIRVTDDDFYNDSERFRIELVFRDLEDCEAKYFTEWLSWKGEGEDAEPFLRVIYDVSKTSERILPADVRAGNDEDGYQLSAEARHLLKTTYLKPLRDAESELIPKRYSRLSQILQEHEVFDNEDSHPLVEEFEKFNESIANYFDGNNQGVQEGKKIKNKINNFIEGFYDTESEVAFKTTDANLKRILESLELSISDIENPGLGTLNRLFMAAELLHLNKEDWDGLRLGLIEELEAHLHPQVQMKVIETLQDYSNIQLILTTHSPNLASKIKLENLIICKEENAFPMGAQYTELDEDNYEFLEKFLDVTKSNLFFAKGVILVEGWSEEILLPTLAKSIGYDLTEHEVSVINVGNLAFSKYYKIFLRQDNSNAINIPVSIVNDVDVKAYRKINKDECEKLDEDEYKEKCSKEKVKKEKKVEYYNSKNGEEISQEIVQPFIAPEWTLEWCLYKSSTLGEIFEEVAKDIHPEIFKDEVDFEKELALRLLPGNKKIEKTEIAYKFVQEIEEKEFNTDQVKEDNYLKYLAEAIEYVCK